MKKEIRNREEQIKNLTDELSSLGKESGPTSVLASVNPNKDFNLFINDPVRQYSKVVAPEPREAKLTIASDSGSQVAQRNVDTQRETAPVKEKIATGIGSLNPQAQATNFAGLFPEDSLGQAIANRGTRIG